ncbi:MAG TPA: hypothetical protein VIH90_06970, partial [Candidatus Saccharimonadales bacterium]
LILALIIGLLARKLRKKKLDSHYYQVKWRNLQKLCSNKKLWYQAIVDADELLDEALKKRRFHGKTTGERLVSAQRVFTDNDGVWFGHKLKKRIAEENYKRLNKGDTLEALSGFRQALKDIGALKNEAKSGVADED